jgi:hypothetical protein
MMRGAVSSSPWTWPRRQRNLVAADREGGFATYRLVERNLEGLVYCLENCSRG